MTDTFRMAPWPPLTEAQKEAIGFIKAQATLLEQQILSAAPAGRYQSIALTKLEECVMWAVKGATAD